MKYLAWMALLIGGCVWLGGCAPHKDTADNLQWFRARYYDANLTRRLNAPLAYDRYPSRWEQRAYNREALKSMGLTDLEYKEAMR